MSYSSEVKEEILNSVVENDCCDFAFLCAVINTIGSIEISRNGTTFSLRSDNLSIIEKVRTIINKVYADKIENLDVMIKTTGKITMYEVSFPSSVGNQILRDCSILVLTEGNTWDIKQGIDHHVILEDCCKNTYLKAVFLCVGSVSVPIEDENLKCYGNYHFEMEFSSAEQAKAVSHLMGEFGFITKRVERNNKSVVYMKDSEMITEFIGFVGATKSYLKLQNERVTRDVRNVINRQNNCASANIDKTVEASLIQLSAINTIKETIGLDALPSDLKDYALLREKNPESSLADLLKICNNKITKSGLNYKLKKLVEIAENL